MFNKKTIKDIDVKGKKVLVRVDFNVPIKEGKIKDDTRIKGAIPTIEYLLKEGAAVILCSHLGRPKTSADIEFTLKPVGEHLAKLLGKPVKFAEDCIGPKAEEAARGLKIPASIPKRRKTTPAWQSSWRLWRTFMSMMHSELPTGHMHPRKVWQSFSQELQVS
jgi:hypothetical protein